MAKEASKTPPKDNNHLHKGHRDRLRSRFLRDGLDGFEDHQVLELALFYALPRRDTNKIAHRLLKRFGSLSAVLEADPVDMATIEGMGDGAAAFLSMLPALTRRYQHDRATRDMPALNRPVSVRDYVVPLMAGRSEEVFYILCLDVQCRLLFPALVSEGTIRQATVHPRSVVEEVIRHKAANVILAHNHPSGVAKPSEDDILLTSRLMQALTPIDVKVLDHLIIAGELSYSFAQEGMMPKR
uniref:Putative DNA repair protein RadC n=1 Tax=Magnetococcus massalia (strain MO-1) TaxID=451514 RepID=A0A1S7LN54_MAGMO|nr:Putative DNA repair protein RadC [Candidatus Magnetococcus massalia]